MPVYTCTIRESSLSADIKAALAREMACVHSSVNNVPTTYVNVAFHELSADSVYTDGIPSNMKPGDVCEIEISGIGVLRNKVVAE